jgi:hypothetical protein
MKESLPEVKIVSAKPLWTARHRIMTKVTATARTKREACEEVLRRVSSCNLNPAHFSEGGVPLRRGY